MSILSLLGGFADLFNNSKEAQLAQQAQQAQQALAVRARDMTKAANINAVGIWAQGVSGTIADQAQYGIDTTQSQIAFDQDMLNKQITAKEDELRVDKVKQVFGFMTDMASTAMSVYAGAMDIEATKPDSSQYHKGVEGSALFLNDYAKWEKSKSLQFARNLMFAG